MSAPSAQTSLFAPGAPGSDTTSGRWGAPALPDYSDFIVVRVPSLTSS
jgi:hypothetical protein